MHTTVQIFYFRTLFLFISPTKKLFQSRCIFLIISVLPPPILSLDAAMLRYDPKPIKWPLIKTIVFFPPVENLFPEMFELLCLK